MSSTFLRDAMVLDACLSARAECSGVGYRVRSSGRRVTSAGWRAPRRGGASKLGSEAVRASAEALESTRAQLARGSGEQVMEQGISAHRYPIDDTWRLVLVSAWRGAQSHTAPELAQSRRAHRCRIISLAARAEKKYQGSSEVRRIRRETRAAHLVKPPHNFER